MSPKRVYEVLKPFRTQLLRVLLRVALAAAIPALITGIYAAVVASAIHILIVDILAYAILIVSYRLSLQRYHLSATAFVYAVLAIGITLVLSVGTEGASGLWLLASVILATILLDRNRAIVVAVLSVAAIVATTILLSLEMLPWSIPFHGWLAVAGSYVGIMIFLTISIAYLFERLAASVLQEQILNREVHHRVRNNLQVVESILSIESGAAIHGETKSVLSLMIDRVAALAHSFAHLRTDTEELVVDLRDLIDALGVDQQQRGRPPVSLNFGAIPATLPLDTAVPLAVVVAELFALFNRSGNALVLTVSKEETTLIVQLEATSRASDTEMLSVPDIQQQIMEALIGQIGGALQLRGADEARTDAGSRGSGEAHAPAGPDVTVGTHATGEAHTPAGPDATAGPHAEAGPHGSGESHADRLAIVSCPIATRGG
jgi:two-component sensor histidine kinase